MKQFLLSLFFSFAFTQVFAQKDVTTFLGRPVDGTRKEMENKLKEKGFIYDKREDLFTGVFNGIKSYIVIKTNKNNKVWRITVADANPVSETEIRIRFNNLCTQFARKSDKYICANESGFYIPSDEDIYYEMTVKNKRYEATYFQIPDMTKCDFNISNHRIEESLLRVYTKEEIANPTEEQAAKIKELTQKEISIITNELLEKKPVWFMIGKYQNLYYIRYFYDNEYNNNDSDDL